MATVKKPSRSIRSNDTVVNNKIKGCNLCKMRKSGRYFCLSDFFSYLCSDEEDITDTAVADGHDGAVGTGGDRPALPAVHGHSAGG